MLNVFFDNPPVLMGDERTQLQQLNSYLFTMSSKLNEALMEVSIQEAQETGTGGGSALTEKDREEQQQAYTSLKQMIIKTADIVKTEMTEITTQLETQVEAISTEFGTLQQNLTSDIRATAEGVLQDYHYEERVTGLETEAGTTEGFIRRTNQYIFSGLIDANTMTYGIAVGEGVTAYDANGNAYLNDNAKCATFTMDRMSFWQGGAELAYFSSGKFYIERGEILKTLQIGTFIWQSMTDNSIALISAT